MEVLIEGRCRVRRSREDPQPQINLSRSSRLLVSLSADTRGIVCDRMSDDYFPANKTVRVDG
jgi:hypothetical protein